MKDETGIIITEFEMTKKLAKQHLGTKTIFYALAFEEGIDDYKNVVGLDKNYIGNEKKSTVALEAHSLYLERMRPGTYQVETRIFDFDGKKAHIFQEIFREKSPIASQETLSISFDLRSRRTCRFEHYISQRYVELYTAQINLPQPASISLSFKQRLN